MKIVPEKVRFLTSVLQHTCGSMSSSQHMLITAYFRERGWMPLSCHE